MMKDTKMVYGYGLVYNGEQIDQTEIDELNENLAWDIMIEDHENKDKNLMSIQLNYEKEDLEEK